jgi:peroxisomal 2,4-dienoyl-CoA reductase
VAKAGVDTLSASTAIEFGPRGITSNIIAPGPIAETEGVRRLARVEGLHENISRIPSGRFGSVKEIADATIYLFADTGSYVNGATLVGKYMFLSHTLI